MNVIVFYVFFSLTFSSQNCSSSAALLCYYNFYKYKHKYKYNKVKNKRSTKGTLERGGFITWEAGGQLKEEHSISVSIFSFPTLFPETKVLCIFPEGESFKAFVRGTFKLLWANASATFWHKHDGLH